MFYINRLTSSIWLKVPLLWTPCTWLIVGQQEHFCMAPVQPGRRYVSLRPGILMAPSLHSLVSATSTLSLSEKAAQANVKARSDRVPSVRSAARKYCSLQFRQVGCDCMKSTHFVTAWNLHILWLYEIYTFCDSMKYLQAETVCTRASLICRLFNAPNFDKLTLFKMFSE